MLKNIYHWYALSPNWLVDQGHCFQSQYHRTLQLYKYPIWQIWNCYEYQKQRVVPIKITNLRQEKKILRRKSNNWGWEKGSTHTNRSLVAENNREEEREGAIPVEIADLREERKKKSLRRESNNWGWEKDNTHINKSLVAGK